MTMTTIATKAFRPMLRPIRKVHVPGTPGIYNNKLNWRPGPNWQPQTPRGPWMDGWAVGGPVLTAYQPGNVYFFLKFMLASCAGFWLPIFALDWQIRKTMNA